MGITVTARIPIIARTITSSAMVTPSLDLIFLIDIIVENTKGSAKNSGAF